MPLLAGTPWQVPVLLLAPVLRLVPLSLVKPVQRPMFLLAPVFRQTLVLLLSPISLLVSNISDSLSIVPGIHVACRTGAASHKLTPVSSAVRIHVAHTPNSRHPTLTTSCQPEKKLPSLEQILWTLHMNVQAMNKYSLAPDSQYNKRKVPYASPRNNSWEEIFSPVFVGQARLYLLAERNGIELLCKHAVAKLSATLKISSCIHMVSPPLSSLFSSFTRIPLPTAPKTP